MGYTFNTDDKANLIEVIYDEFTTLDQRREILVKLTGILDDNPTINVLVDVSRSHHLLTEDEELEFGHLLSENRAFFAKNKTAVVTGVENPHPLIQNEAYIEGFGQMVEFKGRNEALDWLYGRIK